MTLPDAALALRPHACSACGGPLDLLGRCAKCGAAYGEAYRCPLCQALSDVETNSVLNLRCRTCGGPRLAPHESAPSDAEVSLLRSARSEQLRAAAFRVGAGFAVASGVLSLIVTGVVLIAIAPPAFAQLAASLASLVPFGLGFFAFRRAASHRRQLHSALQQAWLLAASRLVRHHDGQLSAEDLAKELRVDESRAELLLAELSVQDFVRGPAELPGRLRVPELEGTDDPTSASEGVEVRTPVGKRPSNE